MPLKDLILILLFKKLRSIKFKKSLASLISVTGTSSLSDASFLSQAMASVSVPISSIKLSSAALLLESILPSEI